MQTVRSADDTTIAIDRNGRGPSLVLVGGAFQDRASMGGVADALGDAFSVYRYDRRGRGDSAETKPYAIERELEDLAAVIEQGGGQAFVFGQSSGGALALEAAARGVPIRALVVNEPPYAGGPTTPLAERLEGLVEQGELEEATATFLAVMGRTPEVIEQLKGEPQWAHMRSFAPTLAHELWVCNDGEIPTERLAQVGASTLVLSGGSSPAWAQTVARRIADELPNGQARVLPGQCHVPQEDVLSSVLEEFFLAKAGA